MGHRPTTPDCMPVLGKSETSNDIFFAFGGQHIGLTIGPKMGSIITNLIPVSYTHLRAHETR